MHRGYFALWRKFQDHKFWTEKRTFSKAEAWIDILMQAQHEKEPTQVVLGMTALTCNYGECLKSTRTWAGRWNWSEAKVRRFFNLLENMKQICSKSEGITTRITILNYSQYDPRATHGRRTADAGAATDKNDNKYISKDIVEHLNQKTGKSFRANSPKTVKCIQARINEGFSLEDFKAVINQKAGEWLKDERMVRYLRPETLFGTKFESYLNEAPKRQPDKPNRIECPSCHTQYAESDLRDGCCPVCGAKIKKGEK